MMGNTLLIRNDDGDYKPAHRSLLEFFMAYKIVAGLGMLPSDFTTPARRQSNIDSGLAPVDYTWSGYFRREVNEDGKVGRIPPLRFFLPENMDTVLDTAGQMGDNVLRFVYEITNIREALEDFHGFISEILKEFNEGKRDPAKEQNTIRFALKFRALSQEWEEQTKQGSAIRQFWKDRFEEETQEVKIKAKIETISIELSGKTPINIEMAAVPAGSFLMGDDNYGPVHRVNITRPFQMATVPVTQLLYQAVMGDNPGDFKGDELPVESVSWFEAVKFCIRLSEKMNIEPAYRIEDQKVFWNQKSLGFRLPTEAEWEYTCRAGSMTRYSCGDLESDLQDVAWYSQNSNLKTHPVGQKRSNVWGIFDMHGNVWEWLWDWRDNYPTSQIDDPIGPVEGSYRVIRGGSWYSEAHNCRSAIRGFNRPVIRLDFLGFRLSRFVALDT